MSDHAITFEAETVSPTEGKIAWKGTVKGDEFTGTFVRYRSPTRYRVLFGNAAVEYWVEAKLKK